MWEDASRIFCREDALATHLRPTIRIGNGGGTGQAVDGLSEHDDLVDRLRPSLLMIARFVRMLPEARRILREVRDRDLALALMVGVRTCQTPIVGENLRAPHRQLQNLYRKSPSTAAAQERHEATRSHALGQLQALLALGYCGTLGVPHISKPLLRPLAAHLVERYRGKAEFAALDPQEQNAGFHAWADKVRQTVVRRRRKSPPEGDSSVDVRAMRAIQKVDVLLQSGRKRPLAR